MDYPGVTMNDRLLLKRVRDLWLQAYQEGVARKQEVYARGAADVNSYYLGNHNYITGNKSIRTQSQTDGGFSILNNDNNPKPMRRMMFTIDDNWAAKYVQTFAPYLTQGEMVRTVEAIKPFIPSPMVYGLDNPAVQQAKVSFFQSTNDEASFNQYMMQQQQAQMQMQMAGLQLMNDKEKRDARSEMMGRALNYTLSELRIPAERRMAVEEALVLGFGALVTEIVEMPGSTTKLIGSNFLMAADIIWDPDASREKDCKWLMVSCREPSWEFSRKYGIPEEEIKPNATSDVGRIMRRKLITDCGGERNINSTAEDEVFYLKVYSRMGCGARLEKYQTRTPELAMLDDQLGDFNFFIISSAIEYPANFGPQTLSNVITMTQQMQAEAQMAAMQGIQVPPVNPAELLKQAASWPTPYYMDANDPWPITVYGFNARNGSPYYIPPLQFVLSYLHFMCWAVCFIADKCYRSQRDFWLLDSKIAKQVREAIESGDDEAILELRDIDGQTLEQFVKILEAPELNSSIGDVYKFFEEKVEGATMLTPLMQANMDRQMRSATEARVTADATMLRPNDMLRRVVADDTRVARKEAIASTFLYTPEDVIPILGQQGALAWQQMFSDSDPVQVMRESEYTVLSQEGTIPDLATRKQQSNFLMQTMVPGLTGLAAATGMYTPVNEVLKAVAESYQIDPALMQYPNMPPPMPAEAKGVASQPAIKGDQGGPK